VAAVPRLSADQAQEIARAHYGFSGSAQRLAAEHDDAFRIVAGDGSSRLLKVSVAAERPGPAGEVSLQAAVLLHLASAAPGLPVQRVIAALDGRPEVTLGAGGRPRLARMTSWLDGEPLGGSTVGRGLRVDIGATLARLSMALRGFSHPGARRTHWWDLQQLGRLRPLLAGQAG
jgi:hydroxylysine kinase